MKTFGNYQKWSIVHDAFDGSDSGIPATPLTEPLILSRPYQVHPAPVVGVLIEEPVAIFHVAGEDVINVEAIHDTGTVIHKVHHLTPKLDPLIQAHVERPRLLVLNQRWALFTQLHLQELPLLKTKAVIFVMTIKCNYGIFYFATSK